MTDAMPATEPRHEFSVITGDGRGRYVVIATHYRADRDGVAFYDAPTGFHPGAKIDHHTFVSHPVFVERGVTLP